MMSMLLTLLFTCLTDFVLSSSGLSIWREDGSVIYQYNCFWVLPRRTHDHILLPPLRLPHLGGPGPRIYIPQEQGGPVIPPPGALCSSFISSYDAQGYGRDILTRHHTGEVCFQSGESIVTLLLTVSQSICLGAEPRADIISRLKVCVGKFLSLWGVLSGERSGLPFGSL
jgi:hypothetical protein